MPPHRCIDNYFGPVLHSLVEVEPMRFCVTDKRLFGFLFPVRALLGHRKRPRLSSNPSPLGSPSSSSMDSNINQTSGPSLDLSPLVHGGPSSTPMDSNINQTSEPSSYLSLLGREGTTSSSSNSIRSCRYDVFMSFRGTDTRNTFVDHLYAHLIRKGIFAFKDDRELRKGELISPQLVQAIQDSRVSIVVFSEDYTSSSWCLDEMATIADCHQKFKQTVFPVFYHMDPSHVRKQNGVYENAFVLHAQKFIHDPGKVNRWKTAMTNLGNSNGWHVKDDKPEFGEIEKIVQAVTKALGHKFSGIANDLIGIQPRVEKLEKLLKLSSENDDFRVLGIWGMGGIGKTTHATVLYDRISYQFVACCFIENVSKIYRDGGAIAVQKQILHKTLGEINLEAYSPSEISGIVRHRLHNIKVLIVLDNVDQLEQLQELAIDPKLLHTGSRMIITTRDEHVLKVYGAQVVYDVPLLNSNDARELLCKKAFKSEGQSSNCVELIPEILEYTQYLPLAIKVLSSFLCTRHFIQWRNALDRLKDDPGNNKIMDVLEISVEGLHPKEREIFLHIACFFKGEREDYVKRILDSCLLYPDIGIPSLIEKSLITIQNQEINVHEMLQELGKKLVRGQYVENPALWSRLWHYKDLCEVFMIEAGKNDVEAIVLHQEEDVSMCMAEAEGLAKMRNLKLLILCQNIFSGSLSFLSNHLRYLFWQGYPFASLPPKFEPYNLAELNMPDSNMQQLWEGRKNFRSLERVDLSNSKCLTKTPNFERSIDMKRLDLTGCTSLLHLHPSIGSLTKLTFLSLQNCSNLVSIDFAGGFFSSSSLRVLRLSGCTKLESTPNFKRALNLEYLDMDGCTSLSLVHDSIRTCFKLRFLSLRNCTNLVNIPSKIITMSSLVTLDLCGCSKLGNFLPLESAGNSSFNMNSWTYDSRVPYTYQSDFESLFFGDACAEQSAGTSSSNKKSRTSETLGYQSAINFSSMISMDLSFCDIRELPDAIGELSCLERLNLQGNKFIDLPDAISSLYGLAYLNLSHCHELEFLATPPSGRASSVGRYFTTTSGARDHRSGFYAFDCPKLCGPHLWIGDPKSTTLERMWLDKLVKEPRNFRCGFDVVIPWNWSNAYSLENGIIPRYFTHKFKGDSIKRITYCNVNDKWDGFVFGVAFEVNNNHLHAISTSPHHSSSLQLPHPFYLSFESEYTEERFDMPLNLELNKIVGSRHLWIIYISREHCHFVKTGADITFKARPGLMVKEWGLCMVAQKNEEAKFLSSDHLCIDIVEKRSNSPELKIQLPYNWSVTEEDEVENFEAKAKENSLSHLGLHTG